MKTITIFLSEGFADWEAAHLAAAARGWYGMSLRYVTQDGAAVSSSGGMRVLPDGALGPEVGEALVVVGAAAWASEAAPQIGPALRAAAERGAVVAGICAATRALASAGLLDGVRHTANAPQEVQQPGYGGAAHYVESAVAVRDGQIVTAPGTAPVSFMAEVLRALGLGSPDLDAYLGMLGAEHRPAT